MFHVVKGRLCVFFFSSRRRHTIWPRDWSSDVCSSDLTVWLLKGNLPHRIVRVLGLVLVPPYVLVNAYDVEQFAERIIHHQIGRASCRERVEVAGGDASVPTDGERCGAHSRVLYRGPYL